MLLIMLFYEKVTVMLMSLEVGKNSGTAILLISAVLYAFIGFFIHFLLPSIMIYELIRNTILLAEYPTSTLEIWLLITQHMNTIRFLKGIHRANTCDLLFWIIMHYCLIYQREFSIRRDKIHYLYLISFIFQLYIVFNNGRHTGIGRKVRAEAKKTT